MAGLLLSDDLIFTSRIVGTGRDLGVDMKVARSSGDLQKLAGQECPGGIILDLANPGLAIEELLGWLRENCVPMPRVVAYGSHVDTATLKRAREAGCDLVLPRSKFVEDLPGAMAGWMDARS